MELNGKIWLAKSDEKVFLEPKMANRHGFIAGASGTGKTITLKVLAESFSQLGVPVFLADIKGDLAGMCKAGVHNESMEKRINKLGIEDWRYRVFPTRTFARGEILLTQGEIAVVRIEVRRELFRRDELEKIVRSMIQQYVSNAGQQAPPAEVQTRQTPAVPQQAVDSAVSRMLDNLDEFL